MFDSICLRNGTHTGFYWLTLVILLTWEVGIRRIIVWGQHWQKVHETPSEPIVGCGYTCLSSQLSGRLRPGGLWSQAILSKKKKKKKPSPPSHRKNLGMHLSPAYFRRHKWESHGPGKPRWKVRASLPNSQSKRAGSVAQVVEHLTNAWPIVLQISRSCR
jgi:hypothetical protein